MRPRRPRGSQSVWEKRRDERFQVPVSSPHYFQKFKQMPAPDWVQNNALYYCAQSANSLFQKYKLELTAGIHVSIGHVLRNY